ncbi:MAG TPA: bifunctional riboflavin kinase/FAD synthetase [Chitinophagaceae bacterium]|nr:bifunctional riboflavin kinase/FAD synthetase [Chitinophagaceae bacterium]
MQVHRDIEHLPVFNNAVITIGTFDGVHTGHQQIIEQLKKEAASVNGETVIITFHPHPRMVVREGQSPVAILTTLEEKIQLLEDKGLNHLVVVPFNEAFAGQTAEAYINDFLVAKFHPHTIIIGYDHRFGKGRKGDYHLLEDCGKKLGFLVKEIPAQVLDDVTVSSTRIRAALLKGDIDTANSCLGYNYHFEGMVVDGNKLGRTLGYPTANIHIHEPEKLVPGNGIYAVRVVVVKPGTAEVKDQPYHQGMMSIGVRPTIGTTERTIEVNIFDFNEDIYGQTLRVYLRKYLRPEVKFNSLDELTDALAKDKINALAALND